MTQLASLDVFDTVLTRVTGSPEGAFLLLGKKLLQSGLTSVSPEAFARSRAAAEALTFRNHGGLDSAVGIDDIYRELGHALAIAPSHLELLKDAEIAFEKEILRTTYLGREIVRTYRDRATSLAFTSDMYLDAALLRALLDAHGLIEDADRVFVSNEHRKSKASGALFELISEQTNVPTADIVHCGNDQRSDVTSPKRRGLSADHFAEGNLNRYERILEKHSFATVGLTSVLAGTSRLVRQDVQVDPADVPLRDVAAGVAAPFVVGLVLWTLRMAEQLGIRRLYYVSRDGQLLHRVASTLISRLGLDIEARYLYGSRQAWTLPAFGPGRPELIDLLFPEYDVDFLSVENVLDRAGLSPASISGRLREIGFADDASRQRNLTASERTDLRDLLGSDAHVLSLIAQRSLEERRLTLRYLEQEGMFDGTPFALVDLGSNATLHKALTEIVVSDGHPKPRSLYLRLTDVDSDDAERVEAYLLNLRSRTGGDVAGIVTALEMFCTADHGTVVRYEERAGRVEPVVRGGMQDAVLEWGYRLIVDVVVRFAETAYLDRSVLDAWTDLRPALREVFNAFWLAPTRAEAERWGTFPFEDGWGEQSVFLQLSSPYVAAEVVGSLVRRRSPWHHRHDWKHGSIALSGSPTKQLMKTAVVARTRSPAVYHKLRRFLG